MDKAPQKTQPDAIPQTAATGHKRGRPKGGGRVDWHQIETEYVTANYTLEQLAERHDVSRSLVMQHSSRDSWRKKRERHRARVARAAEAQAITRGAVPVAQEIRQVSALTQGAMARLAQAIAATGVQRVTCPGCGHVHDAETPRFDITPAHLLQLLNAREKLRADPNYVPEAGETDEIEARRVERLSPDELREEVAEVLADASTYDL